MTNSLMRWMVVTPLVALFASCGLNNADVWNQNYKESLRSQVCAQLNVDVDTVGCTCIVTAIVTNFDTPSRFKDSNGPTPEIIMDIKGCGYEW